MASPAPKRVQIPVTREIHVAGLMLRPVHATACLVFAHGAGAGMDHPFMAAVAGDLAARDIATLRFQFPYMERHPKRPDPPALCHATVRAAVATARELAPPLTLFAGGKSFGGRMISQAQAEEPLPHVRGLVFFGFPLHPPKVPSIARGEHLSRIGIPMLFLQGTRDALAELPLAKTVVEKLGKHAQLKLFENADHSFHVPVRSGRSDADVLSEMLETFVAWTDRIIKDEPSGSPQ
jgi:predicted alpha/beta-hydrolase family hydrolase